MSIVRCGGASVCLLFAFAVNQFGAEPVDLGMYQRIREEGYYRSRVMEYASALFDGIGARLTGSPNAKKANEWTRDQLAAMGCVNARVESWGEFGMGWERRNVWIRMTAPGAAVFIADAAPWSPATKGTVAADVIAVSINDESDFSKYKGKLAGRVVLLGQMRDPAPIDEPFFHRYDEKELAGLAGFPLTNSHLQWSSDAPDRYNFFGNYPYTQLFNAKVLAEKTGAFLAAEGALAVLVPSRDNGKGGNGGTILDDSNDSLGWFAYRREHAMKVPVAVIALENAGRMFRLLDQRVPVHIEVNIDTRFTGDHEQGYNTIAEIPGVDPTLKDQVVLFGGHLDSWSAGTGATDDGAAVVVAMEAMRILRAIDVHPRRAIRVALWTGEEQGLLGSIGYVRQHFGSFPLSTSSDQINVPELFRKPAGPLALKPEQKLVSAYFNLDAGGGRIRGIQTQENAAVVPIFEEWIAPLRDLGVAIVSQRSRSDGDHTSFDNVGIPGFNFTLDPLDYRTRSVHSNMDTYERLIPADLQQAAIVEATFVYNTAMRDQLLPRTALPHPESFGQKPPVSVMPGAQTDQKP
jgi:hypothetical protein